MYFDDHGLMKNQNRGKITSDQFLEVQMKLVDYAGHKNNKKN